MKLLITFKIVLALLALNGLFQFRSTMDKSTYPSIKNKIYVPNEITGVKIGNQIWMTQNLKVAHFRNGDSVPYAKTAEEWEKAGKDQKPAWCYYNNDPANDNRYGKLYNWYAVNDSRGLAPEGWHIPSDVEWKQLTDFIGGNEAAGKKMKSISGWELNGNGTNESGFNGLPGGYRYDYGFFNYGGLFAVWWASPVNYISFAWLYYQAYNFGNAFRYFPTKSFGFSVRCVKN
jgi:uncharacterized protein (TIGR02145 family)